MRTNIYNLINDCLTAIKHEEKPLIKHIDYYNNQTAQPMEEQPFNLPAVFVEFAPIDYEPLTNGASQSVCEFALHVVTDARKFTIKKAMEINTNLCCLIYSALMNHKNTNISSIIRVQSTTDTNFDEWIENIETFRVAAFCTHTMRNYDISKINEVALDTNFDAH